MGSETLFMAVLALLVLTLLGSPIWWLYRLTVHLEVPEDD